MDEAVQAGRVVVMDQGQILKDGTPKEIFAEVPFLKEHDLDVPQATELMYRLKKAGAAVSEIPLNTEECIQMLAGMLKK